MQNATDPVASTRAVEAVQTVKGVANGINSQSGYLEELIIRLEALMNDIGIHSNQLTSEKKEQPAAPGLGSILNEAQERFADNLSRFEGQLDVMSKELT